MSGVTLERLIAEYLAASPDREISFIWHGGEPTLAGLEFYQQVVRLQERYLQKGRSCYNNLQTNGILLDDNWCSFLAKHNFGVGLSLDATPEIHDTYRRDRGGNGSYQASLQAVYRLQRHGIKPDLLCTVTADAAQRPLDAYRSLRDLQTGWIQFIPIVRRDLGGDLTPDSVTGEAYGEFLCRVFDEWLLHDFGVTGVQLFAETMLVAAGGEPSLCWMQASCGRALIVESDGDIYSCDHFVDSNHFLGFLGSSTTLDAALHHRDQRKFGNVKRDTLPQCCRICDVLLYCHGGCPKDRFPTSSNPDPDLNVLCTGLHAFFNHAETHLRRLLALRKRNLPDHTIRELMAKRF